MRVALDMDGTLTDPWDPVRDAVRAAARTRRRPPTRYDYDDVFRFIVAFKTEHGGDSPTIREIAAGCGISSTSVTTHILRALERRGKIQLGAFGRTRSIRVVGGEWRMRGEPETVEYL